MKSALQSLARTCSAAYRRFFTLDLAKMVQTYQIPRDGLLHVGANHGQEAEIYNRLGFRSVLWIEGLPSFYHSLKTTIAPFPEQTAFNIFATDIDHEDVVIRIADTEGASTLLEPSKDFENITFIAEERYTARRIDAFFAEKNIPLDGAKLLVLDVEGYELKAMKGLGNLIDGFDWILTEISIVPNYVGGPTLRTIDDFLLAHNYKRVKTWIGQYSGDSLYKKAPSISLLTRSSMRLSSALMAVLYRSGLLGLKVKIRQVLDSFTKPA